MKNSKVFFTNHYVNQIVTQFFAKANSINLESINNYKYNNDITFISYGILRGTGQIFSKSKNFIYIDHGYINSSKREFTSDKRTSLKSLNGYFRVVKNDLYFNKNFNNPDNTRFNELDIKLKNLNQNGKKIILSEPSDNTLNFLKIPNWTNETIEEIKKYPTFQHMLEDKFIGEFIRTEAGAVGPYRVNDEDYNQDLIHAYEKNVRPHFANGEYGCPGGEEEELYISIDHHYRDMARQTRMVYLDRPDNVKPEEDYFLELYII